MDRTEELLILPHVGVWLHLAPWFSSSHFGRVAPYEAHLIALGLEALLLALCRAEAPGCTLSLCPLVVLCVGVCLLVALWLQIAL